MIPEACAKWIPDEYNIHKLYQKYGKVTVEKWIKAFSEPSKFLILHVGNGYFFSPTNWWYQLNLDFIFPFRIKFKNSDVCRLRNDFFPIHISISCLTGNFCDTDCLAEELLLWSQGGPSACFFNSEVGSVDEKNASKYSGEFIEKIFYELFYKGTNNLGKINCFAKYHFVDLAEKDSKYRYCFYEMNLLGDPETPAMDTRNRLHYPTVFVDDDFNESILKSNLNYFNSIQDAIEVIPIGGTVFVYNGTYNESIIIDKSLTLVGENKYHTIIETDKNIVVTMRSNSSSIYNFTIRHRYLNETDKQIGIYIPKNCWGNEIYNNIIVNNSYYGILGVNTCRTIIHDNIIEFNGNGIGLTDKTYGLLSTHMVITCYNIIQYNKIAYNENYGLFLEHTLNNEVTNNTFICNGYEDAYFKLCRNIRWDGNYWGKPWIRRFIPGIYGPIFIWSFDFSKGILFGMLFPSQKYYAIINIGIPIGSLDNNPSDHPYEIS